jgi:hypothetical protein
LGEQNKIFQFAATAPGLTKFGYRKICSSFKAFDENGNEISVNPLSVNQWEISIPTLVKKYL